MALPLRHHARAHRLLSLLPLRPKHTTPSSNSQHATSTRHLHARVAARPIPEPTPFCPDVPTFLSLIGRDLSQHSSKIPDWPSLFRLTSPQLRELGIEPARSRRYLLRWRDRFARGEFGVGGALRHVREDANGVRKAAVWAVDVPAREGKATVNRTPGWKRAVLNLKGNPEELTAEELKEAAEVDGVRGEVHQAEPHGVYGSHVEKIKGTGGRGGEIKVKEGLWEQKRGRKVDGGERRRAMVRAKRRAEERKKGTTATKR